MKRSFVCLVGEFALQIQKIRARNMPGLERVPSGYDDIGNVAAFRRRFQIGRAIEQPQFRIVEKAGEFRRADEPASSAMCQASPRLFASDARASDARMKRPAPVAIAL